MGGFESHGNDVHAAGAERKGSSLRVLIVDDHMLFAEAIKSAVAGIGIEVVAVATTGEEGVKEVRRSRPDLVLMDVVLPDQSGLAAGRRILDEVPDTKILALTALDDQSVADEAIQIGFHGYLTKDTPVTLFMNSIRAVLDGQMVLPHRLGPARRSGRATDAALMAAQLTDREREVLARLVRGESGREIAAHLGISRNTVRTHVQGILTKLQVHSRLEAAAFAVRHRIVQLPSTSNPSMADPSRAPATG